MTRVSCRGSSIFLILTLLVAIGCEPQREALYVYEVYSEYEDKIRILNCDGLGEAQPGGIVGPTYDGVPNATLVFPRVASVPTNFTIQWVNLRTNEEFQQNMTFPTIPPAAHGVIECRLSKDNVWTWSFRQER